MHATWSQSRRRSLNQCTTAAAHMLYTANCALSLTTQTTVSLCLLAQQRAFQQHSERPLVACCLPWRRPAAFGAGELGVDENGHLYACAPTSAALVNIGETCIHACTIRAACAHSHLFTCHRKTAWRCFLAAVVSTFTLQTLSRNASHGMISFTGVHAYENRDWAMQLPFILLNAGKQ
jgi:hypothetical protein